MQFRNINNVTLAFDDRGDGPPLALLHGFPLDSRVWDDAADRLRRSARIITLDLRGFGQSACGTPFTLDVLAEDVHALLSAIGALPCRLGGLSMGGYVALAFARRFAVDLERLLLIDTKAAADTAEARAGRDQMIQLARTGGSGAVARQMFPRMLAPASQTCPVAGRLLQIMESCPAKTIEHALAAMRDRPDYTPLLPRLSMPVLIMAGEHDAITPPSMAREMQAAIDNAQLAIIPEAGHMSPLENPAAFAAAVETFLL
jgi:pimeloyl-ACP methyl ester carboxylesterase